MNTDTPETDAAAGSLTGINLCAAFETKCRNLERQRNEALAALEREQIRLAACGVVALSDTPDSAAAARKMHPDYESASCNDVKRRVDECIALRQLACELRDALRVVYNLPDSCPCGITNEAMAAWHDVGIVLGSAQKLLP